MTTQNNVNIQMLKDRAAANPKYKALWELYGKRERGRQDSTVPRARRVLKAAGIDMTTEELKKFYADAQEANAGTWNVRRRRFVWAFHLKSIADNVNGHKYVVDPAKTVYRKEPKSGKQVVDREASGYLRVPLDAADILKSAPRPRVRLPRLAPVSNRQPDPIPMSTADEIPLAREMPRAMTIKRAGFEIALPLAMSEEERKDAAAFLSNLPQ